MAYMNTAIDPNYGVSYEDIDLGAPYITSPKRGKTIDTNSIVLGDRKGIEMHCHSTRSDGVNREEEIIVEAKRLGLGFLALTDHDVISSQKFQSNLRSEGIDSCDSVEISACNPDLEKSLHLVSYANIFKSSLYEVLKNSRDNKMKMKQGQFEILTREYGFSGNRLEFDAYMRRLGREPETSNKYDMSKYFYSEEGNREKMKNILGDISDDNDIVGLFYQECLKRGGKLYDTYGYESEEYEPSVELVVEEVVTKAGGLVSMAHPNVTFTGNKGGIPEFERSIADYTSKGVRGIEINTMASPEWVEAIMNAKKKYDLILTFGSDCHKIGYDGSDGKHGSMGQLNNAVNTSVVEKSFEQFQNLVR